MLLGKPTFINCWVRLGLYIAEISIPHTTPFVSSDSGGANAKTFPQNFCCMLAPTDCEHCAVAPVGREVVLILATQQTFTEMSKILCTWLREVCSCCSLTVLPGPAWVLLIYDLQRILLISVQ